MSKKWDIELNKWGQPAPINLLRLMIAESWERGDFNTEHLEAEDRKNRRIWLEPKFYRYPGAKR